MGNKTQTTPDEISERVRKICTAIIEDERGVWLNPEFVTHEQVALAVRIFSRRSKGQISTGPLMGSVEFIHEHEYMPARVEWAAEIHVRGATKSVWASKHEKWGVDFQKEKVYWLEEHYQNYEDNNE